MTSRPLDAQGGSAGLPRGLWVLLAANVVIALGFGLIAPALPIFASEFGVGVTAATAVVSAFAVMRLAFAPTTGRLVTRLGERRIYLTGLLIVALSTLACAFAQDYWQLLAFRAAGGIGSTMFSVSAMALLIRLAPPEMRGRSSGYFSAGFLIGSLAGPLIGAALVDFGLRLPFIVYAIALLIAAVVVAANMPAAPLAASSADTDSTKAPAAGFLEALRWPEYRAILASNFAQGWASMGVRIAVVPLFVGQGLGRSAGWAGVVLACYAAGNIIAILVSGRLSDKFGRRPVMIPGLMIAAASTAVLGFSPNIGTLLALTAIGGIGSGLFAPTHQAALGDLLADRQRGGSALAAYGMSSDFGAVSGPLIAGVIADRWGYGPAFVVTGGVVAIALLLWLVAGDPARRSCTTTSSEATSVDPTPHPRSELQ
ncbi:Predicted arabinose efflux permease, MFS family [Gordonia malaquae]|uniref:Putative major facilitator superfamily transporter n=1 Tax=Gordonia malaquae NBRC 108250 TaxID=1223542 RepID=M3THX8_GORML|nr:MFS transporter [Gordonia malaquae]GAC81111.1 putative major facilitator superfamily transporter [Gordonia malaquae NBRC 108250]SEB99067.1 Predicted arabinose efflux permease, MFS family [Gordonia malaquae]